MLLKLVLWASNSTLVVAVSNWHARAQTAWLASEITGRPLCLRDVLPGPAYPIDGPWTDAELRATPPVPFDASSARQSILSLAVHTSQAQSVSPVHRAVVVAGPKTGPKTPVSKSGGQ